MILGPYFSSANFFLRALVGCRRLVCPFNELFHSYEPIEFAHDDEIKRVRSPTACGGILTGTDSPRMMRHLVRAEYIQPLLPLCQLLPERFIFTQILNQSALAADIFGTEVLATF